jgi:CheY-like chemotaxis protein
VDDEIEQLKLRAQVIRMCGFAAITANGPMEAIDIMTARQRGTIDLAILDYNMPVMNGCVLAERLKSIWPETKIMLHSGAIDIPQNEMTSVDALIPKGEGVEQLLAQIIRVAQIRTLPPATVAADEERSFQAHKRQS